MKNPAIPLLTLGLFLAGVGGWWAWQAGSGATKAAVSPAALRERMEVARPTQPRAKAGHGEILAGLEAFRARLNAGVPPAEALKILEEMTTLLWTSDPTQVGAAIRAFLDGGYDAKTGLAFQVGENGLSSAPSLRVALLDLLEKLDLGEAADYAKVLVSQMRQPDEVAVALRTLMRLPEDDPRRELAITGVDQMLQREDWRNEPTGGYLEAFDIASETDQPAIWKRMLNMTINSGGDPRTLLAAVLAVQTLAVRSPEFRALIADHESPLTIPAILRGQLMAHLDPRIPEELTALNTFVADASIPLEEAQAFAANFPSQRDLVGFRLLTDTTARVRPLEEAARLDIAAEATARQWSTGSLPPQWKPLMAELASRLEQIAKSASKAL